jgi:hypothetical protein
MRRISLRLASALGALALAVPGFAQTSDHLACFKARDNAPRARYSLTLSNDAGTLGCKLKVPAKLVCLETTKTNVSPTPPGGGPTGATGGFLCYQLKCPRGQTASGDVQDQFGRRTVRFRGAQLLCAPATRGTLTIGPAPGPRGSTTTTTLATSGCRFTDGRCVGQCAGGARCATAASSTSCECRSTACGDADAPECNGFCTTQGEACIFSVTGCSCVRVP